MGCPISKGETRSVSKSGPFSAIPRIGPRRTAMSWPATGRIWSRG